MNCNSIVTVTDTLICAKACTVKFNEQPLAVLGFTGTTLSDESEYFDKGDISGRQVRWTIYIGDYLFYDFGYNGYFDVVPELANGSIYSTLDLGISNADILAFIEGQQNVIVPEGTKFTMFIEVEDNTGIVSDNVSNKYCFSK